AAHSKAASPSHMGRFETQWLAAPANLSALADLSGQWIELVHGRRPPRGIVLDMDSSVSPTHGELEMSVWNGHYACAGYHPLFVFNQFGDLERSALRPGNVHSADGWNGVLKPVVARYQGKVSRIYFRADAAFAMPEVYEFLEAERIKYAIRLPANQILQHRISYLLKRPDGVVMRDVHRQCRAAPASCTRLQSRQFPAHAGDVGADQDWSLTSLKEKLIKIGAKVVSHGRYVVFQMAEVAIPRQMFQEILRLIAELRPQRPPAPA